MKSRRWTRGGGGGSVGGGRGDGRRGSRRKEEDDEAKDVEREPAHRRAGRVWVPECFFQAISALKNHY